MLTFKYKSQMRTYLLRVAFNTRRPLSWTTSLSAFRRQSRKILTTQNKVSITQMTTSKQVALIFPNSILLPLSKSCSRSLGILFLKSL